MPKDQDLFPPAQRLFPAFFSYARVDDRALGDPIRKYVDEFKPRIEALVRRELGDVFGPLDEVPAPYFDLDDPTTRGEIDDIIVRNIENSYSLFVCVGKGYTKSQRCFQELEHFVNNPHRNSANQRNRIWILVWEPLPAEIEKQLADMWKPLHLERLRFKFEKLYDESENPFEPDSAELNKHLTRVTRELATEFVEACKSTATTFATTSMGTDAGPQPVQSRKIVLGLVTQDVLPARDRLEKALGGFDLVKISEDDFAKGLGTPFRGARMAVLPFSPARVRFPDFVPGGGHLTLQRDAAAKVGCPVVFWSLPSSGDPLIEPEADEAGLRVLDACRKDAKSTIEEVLRTIRGEDPPPKKIVKLWFEWNKPEQHETQLVRERIMDLYSSELWPEGLRELEPVPKDLYLDGIQSENGDIDGDGVVLLCGGKSDSELQQTVATVSKLLAKHMKVERQLPLMVALLMPPHTDDRPVLNDAVALVVRFDREKPNAPRQIHKDDREVVKAFLDRVARSKSQREAARASSIANV